MNSKSAMTVVALTVGLTMGGAVLQGCATAVVGGMVAGAAVVADRRPPGSQLDDERIENSALLEAKRRHQDGTHLNITSYNQAVLITGEVFNDAQKKDIEEIVKSNRLVRTVHNELGVMPVASLASVSADSALTARVKAKLIETAGVSANNVKVVTERRIVYLMGLLNKEESVIATDAVRSVSGVEKVVRLFELRD